MLQARQVTEIYLMRALAFNDKTFDHKKGNLD